MSSAVASSSNCQRLETTVRAGELEGPGEADQALATDLSTEAALAGREHDQVGIEAHFLVDFPDLEQAVVPAFLKLLRARQGQVGVQGEARAEVAPGGEVDDTGALTDGLGLFFRGSSADEGSGGSLGVESDDPVYLVGIPESRQGEGVRVVICLAASLPPDLGVDGR